MNGYGRGWATVSVVGCSLGGYMFKNGVARSCAPLIPNFLKNCHFDFLTRTFWVQPQGSFLFRKETTASRGLKARESLIPCFSNSLPLFFCHATKFPVYVHTQTASLWQQQGYKAWISQKLKAEQNDTVSLIYGSREAWPGKSWETLWSEKTDL